MPGVQLIESGAMQGYPAVILDAGSLQYRDDPLAIVAEYMRIRVPGAVHVMLQNAPWGDLNFEEALMMFHADARTGSCTVWAERSCMETDMWSAAPVWWVMDTSVLLAATLPDTLQNIAGMPYVPPPDEIVVRDPSPASLCHTHLDELSSRLDPDYAWLYVKQEDMEAATKEVAKATTSWGIRLLGNSSNG